MASLVIHPTALGLWLLVPALEMFVSLSLLNPQSILHRNGPWHPCWMNYIWERTLKRRLGRVRPSWCLPSCYVRPVWSPFSNILQPRPQEYRVISCPYAKLKFAPHTPSHAWPAKVGVLSWNLCGGFVLCLGDFMFGKPFQGSAWDILGQLWRLFGRLSFLIALACVTCTSRNAQHDAPSNSLKVVPITTFRYKPPMGSDGMAKCKADPKGCSHTIELSWRMTYPRMLMFVPVSFTFSSGLTLGDFNFSGGLGSFGCLTYPWSCFKLLSWGRTAGPCEN